MANAESNSPNMFERMAKGAMDQGLGKELRKNQDVTTFEIRFPWQAKVESGPQPDKHKNLSYDELKQAYLNERDAKKREAMRVDLVGRIGELMSTDSIRQVSDTLVESAWKKDDYKARLELLGQAMENKRDFTHTPWLKGAMLDAVRGVGLLVEFDGIKNADPAKAAYLGADQLPKLEDKIKKEVIWKPFGEPGRGTYKALVDQVSTSSARDTADLAAARVVVDKARAPRTPDAGLPPIDPDDEEDDLDAGTAQPLTEQELRARVGYLYRDVAGKRISAADAEILANKPLEDVDGWVHGQLDHFLNGNGREYKRAVKALGVFEDFQRDFRTEQEQIQFDKLKERVEDVQKLVEVRTLVRSISETTDTEAQAKSFSTNQAIMALAETRDGGAERLDRWWGGTMQFLKKMDAQPGLWQEWLKKEAGTVVYGPNKKVVSPAEVEAKLAKIESDSVNRSTYLTLLESLGVLAERDSVVTKAYDAKGKVKEEVFRSKRFYNLAAGMNAKEYYIQKRKIPPHLVQGADSIVMSFVSFVRASGSNESLGEVGMWAADGVRCTDVSQSNIDKIKPSEFMGVNAYREWAKSTAEGVGSLSSVERLVRSPDPGELAKFWQSGLSHAYTILRDTSRGDGNDYKEQYAFDKKRDAVVIDVSLPSYENIVNTKFRQLKVKASRDLKERTDDRRLMREAQLTTWEEFIGKFNDATNEDTQRMLGRFLDLLIKNKLYPSGGDNVASVGGEIAKGAAEGVLKETLNQFKKIKWF